MSDTPITDSIMQDVKDGYLTPEGVATLARKFERENAALLAFAKDYLKYFNAYLVTNQHTDFDATGTLYVAAREAIEKTELPR